MFGHPPDSVVDTTRPGDLFAHHSGTGDVRNRATWSHWGRPVNLGELWDFAIGRPPEGNAISLEDLRWSTKV